MKLINCKIDQIMCLQYVCNQRGGDEASTDKLDISLSQSFSLHLYLAEVKRPQIITWGLSGKDSLYRIFIAFTTSDFHRTWQSNISDK